MRRLPSLLPALVALGALAVHAPGCRGVQPAPEEAPPRASSALDPAPAGPGVKPVPPSPPGAPATAAAPGRLLQLSDLFGKVPLAGHPATKVTWSHDGRWLYALRPSAADARVLDLWRLAVPGGTPERLVSAAELLAQGKVELTEAQKAAQERRRVRHRGITSFVLDRTNTAVLIPLAGYLYRFDLKTRKAARVFATPGGELDPRPAPEGGRIAFVRGGNVILRDLASGAERPLTRDGGKTLQYGVAEFVAQEELDRFRGHWWSPTGRFLALTRVDESSVARVQRHRISATGVKVVPQRYPAAGTPNAQVRLGVATVATGQIRWLAFGPLEAGYLARVRWYRTPAPGNLPRLAVQWLSRDQRTLTLHLVDPVTGATTLALTERAPDYVNLHDDLRLLRRRPGFLWSSEATGLRQLALHPLPAPGPPGTPPAAVGWDASGARPRPLGRGAPLALSRLAEPVLRLEGVDEPGGWFYASVLANRGRELHLYRFALDGARLPQRLTRRPGWHAITMNRTATHYVDRWSDLDTPPQLSLHQADGTRLQVLDANPPRRWKTFARATTRFVTLRAADDTPLNGLLFTPPGTPGAGARPRPAVMYVYGGPHGHTVARRWQRTTPWHHFLAQRGFAVLLVDGRGTAHRGKAFEAKLWRRFGEVDAQDVAAAARWLGAQPGIDRDRLGLWGWSYGGYLTVMTALQTGRLFRAAVAVAPVGDWRLYDTAYTERYLGLPKANAEVYRRSDPVPLAARLETPLLLVHGMADDNVLLTHTLRLTKALQDAGRPFDMMLYPGKAHSIKGTATRQHLLATLLRYFRQHLQGRAPPEARP